MDIYGLVWKWMCWFGLDIGIITYQYSPIHFVLIYIARIYQYPYHILNVHVNII